MSLKKYSKLITIFVSILLAAFWSVIVALLFQGWGGFKADITLPFIGLISMPYVLLTLFNVTHYQSKTLLFCGPILLFTLIVFFVLPSPVPAGERLPLFVFFLFFSLMWGGWHLIFWGIIKPRLAKQST